jgi:hypothetical protein
MKKIAIIIVIVLVIIGSGYLAIKKLQSIFGVEGEKKTENGMTFIELKKLPNGVKINFKVEDSCEKPGHDAIKFSIEGLKSAKVKQLEYEFTYTDENKGSLQGNGTTMPVTVREDKYTPMTVNCNEYGLFSCSAGGKCVFYKVKKIDATYKFYFENGEVGVWKESYKVG